MNVMRFNQFWSAKHPEFPGKAVYAITVGSLKVKIFLASPEDPAQAARGQLQRQGTQSTKFCDLHP